MIFSFDTLNQSSVSILTVNTGGTGIYELTGFTETIIGATSTRYFERQFAVSNDNILYTSWQTLTIENIQQVVSSTPNSVLYFKIKYTRVGSDTTGTLVLDNLVVTYTTWSGACVVGNIGKDSIFKDILCGNPIVWQITQQLLKSIKEYGILPNFIERNPIIEGNDEDFDAFWSSITKVIGLLTTLCKKLTNIYQDKDLLKEYLRQKDLLFGTLETLEELQTIASTYYSEIFKRGTVLIHKSVNDYLVIITNEGSVGSTTYTFITGELLRFLDHELTLLPSSSLYFNIPNENQVGWCTDIASPLDRSIDSYQQLLQLAFGERLRDNVGSDGDEILYFKLLDPDGDWSIDQEELLYVADESINKWSGISDPTLMTIQNPSVSYAVNVNIPYEISFMLKCLSSDIKMKLEVRGYDKNANYISSSFKEILTNTTTNTFYESSTVNVVSKTNVWHHIRAIIHPIDFPINSIYGTNESLKAGTHLKFNSSQVYYVVPIIHFRTSTVGASCRLKTIRFKVAYLPSELGFVDIKNLAYYLAENKNININDKDILHQLKYRLLPYDTNIEFFNTKSGLYNLPMIGNENVSCPTDSITATVITPSVIQFNGTPNTNIVIEFYDQFNTLHVLNNVTLPFTYLNEEVNVYGLYILTYNGICKYYKQIAVPPTTTTTTTAAPTTTTTTTTIAPCPSNEISYVVENNSLVSFNGTPSGLFAYITFISDTGSTDVIDNVTLPWSYTPSDSDVFGTYIFVLLINGRECEYSITLIRPSTTTTTTTIPTTTTTTEAPTTTTTTTCPPNAITSTIVSPEVIRFSGTPTGPFLVFFNGVLVASGVSLSWDYSNVGGYYGTYRFILANGCEYVIVVTETTTTTTESTTLIPSQLLLGGPGDESTICAETTVNISTYGSGGSLTTLGYLIVGNTLYEDSGLTTSLADGWYKTNNGRKIEVVGGVIIQMISC